MSLTNESSASQQSHCPQCGTKGKKVKRITLDSLLTSDATARVSDTQFRFCDAPDCDTVYFGDDGTTFSKSDLKVRVGVKEHTSPRHVCYCFDHTIEEIDSEVQETGTSTVLEDIKTRMKDACWCETKSPLGSCCLGTVGKYVKLSLAEHALMEHGAPQVASAIEEEPADCCANTDAKLEDMAKSQRTGMLATGGSVLSALAASACCWIPLLLFVFGVSAGGVSAWFEHYRWVFLGSTAILLGTGFYFVYFRKSHCAPGSACMTPNLKLQRFNRAMLWVATLVVIVTAAFPKYVGYLIPDGGTPQIVATSGSVTTAVLSIEGMTCEACTIHIKSELSKVPGVLSATVSYTEGNASINFDSNDPPATADLITAIEKAGYSGMVENQNLPHPSP